MHESCQKKLSHLISRTKKILPPDMAVTVELAVSCESSTRDPVYKPHRTLWSSSERCKLDISRSSERRLLHCIALHPSSAHRENGVGRANRRRWPSRTGDGGMPEPALDPVPDR